MTGKRTFLIDVDRCTGCHLCVIACKDEHVGNAHEPWARPQPDTGHFWVAVRSLERGRIPRVRMTYLPVFCQHCENAPCIKACPDGAIKRRDDALVWIDPGACTGCGLCPDACPYGVIYVNAELGIAQKCTGCAHRVDEGLAPRCVDICPHDAILFGEDADPAFRPGDGGRPLEVYHPEYLARPRVHWKGLPGPWIAGTVVDAASDEVLAGATVTAVDLFEDGATAAVSDGFGDFWIRGLEPHRKYQVAIRKDGYAGAVAIATTDGDQDLGEIRLERSRTPSPSRV